MACRLFTVWTKADLGKVGTQEQTSVVVFLLTITFIQEHKFDFFFEKMSIIILRPERFPDDDIVDSQTRLNDNWLWTSVAPFTNMV